MAQVLKKQAATIPLQKNPRDIKRSALKQAAWVLKTYIQASAYRSGLLTALHKYLAHVEHELHHQPADEINLEIVEKDLEAIEAALVHLWVCMPYNEALTIPRRLPDDHIHRIKEVVKESRRLNRPLRLAHSRKE